MTVMTIMTLITIITIIIVITTIQTTPREKRGDGEQRGWYSAQESELCVAQGPCGAGRAGVYVGV
jgi:uncharacterized membrane protein